jgi:hypothetical protein
VGLLPSPLPFNLSLAFLKSLSESHKFSNDKH